VLTIDINGKPKDRSALNNMIDPNYLEQIKLFKDINQAQDVLPHFNSPDILNDDDPYYSKIQNHSYLLQYFLYHTNKN
jgi:hypothetical protein